MVSHTYGYIYKTNINYLLVTAKLLLSLNCLAFPPIIV